MLVVWKMSFGVGGQRMSEVSTGKIVSYNCPQIMGGICKPGHLEWASARATCRWAVGIRDPRPCPHKVRMETYQTSGDDSSPAVA